MGLEDHTHTPAADPLENLIFPDRLRHQAPLRMTPKGNDDTAAMMTDLLGWVNADGTRLPVTPCRDV